MPPLLKVPTKENDHEIRTSNPRGALDGLAGSPALAKDYEKGPNGGLMPDVPGIGC